MKRHEKQRGDAYKRLLRQERLILEVTESVARALEDGCITETELARRLGRTRSYVSKALDGRKNLTLRTIADITAALALRASFRLDSDTTARDTSVEAEGHKGEAPELRGKANPGAPGSANQYARAERWWSRARSRRRSSTEVRSSAPVDALPKRGRPATSRAVQPPRTQDANKRRQRPPEGER